MTPQIPAPWTGSLPCTSSKSYLHMTLMTRVQHDFRSCELVEGVAGAPEEALISLTLASVHLYTPIKLHHEHSEVSPCTLSSMRAHFQLPSTVGHRHPLKRPLCEGLSVGCPTFE